MNHSTLGSSPRDSASTPSAAAPSAATAIHRMTRTAFMSHRIFCASEALCKLPESHLIALLARTRQIPSMRVLPSTQTAFSTALVLAVLIDATLRWNLTSHSRTNGEKNSETLVQNCSPVIRRRRAVLQRRRRIRTIQQHLELEHRDHNFGP